MDLAESTVHSFIVKLSLQEIGDETRRVVWHGYITHVPDGERRYLNRLSDITPFIASYLEGAGVDPKSHSRVRRWFRWLGSHSRHSM
jgi:hypothetical protein